MNRSRAPKKVRESSVAPAAEPVGNPIEMTLGAVHKLIAKAIERWLDERTDRTIEDLVLVISVRADGKARVTASERGGLPTIVPERPDIQTELRARVNGCTPAVFDFDDGQKHVHLLAWLRLGDDAPPSLVGAAS